MYWPRVCRAGLAWLAVLSTVAANAAEVWRTDYDSAAAEARELKRPLLVHFYGTYCPPCRKMERDVLHTAETHELLGGKFIAVKIDAGDAGNEQSMRLVQRFGVQALPCDIILDPMSGRVLSQRQGYQDQRSYSSVALASWNQFEQSLKTHLLKNAQTATKAPAPIDADVAIELGDAQPIVGLDGYSPVALSKRREWVRGKLELAWEYKGITYHLADDGELDEFRAKPEDFAPRLLGCDPVLLAETDRAIAGDTRYGAFFDGDLYLFQTADSRKRFKANPARYTRIQHVLRVDKIERTAVH